MATVRANLKAAHECIGRGEYKEALAHCKAALKLDKASYETYV